VGDALEGKGADAEELVEVDARLLALDDLGLCVVEFMFRGLGFKVEDSVLANDDAGEWNRFCDWDPGAKDSLGYMPSLYILSCESMLLFRDQGLF